MTPAVLILPGYGASGEDHWQTLWERRHGYTRVEQDDWLEPVLDDWVHTLDRAVAAQSGPVVLVAHSLGCALVARWAAISAVTRVVGALLVAPADVDSPQHTPEEVRGFAPLPLMALPFRSIVVASETDPFMTIARARQLADHWGAALVNVGPRGHINAEAGVGAWSEGHELLTRLLHGVANR
jgi:uncharacterized protein